MHTSPHFGLVLTIVLNVLHMGYTVGVVMTKISYLEETTRVTRAKSEEIAAVNVKMATVETKLTSISEQLGRLESALARGSK